MTDQGGQTPPGWYPAMGDPPGTQRYWDGTQWQGGPQPVGGTTPGGSHAGFARGGQPAELEQRFIASLIDLGIGIALFVMGFIVVVVAAAISETFGGIMVLVWLLFMFGFNIYNTLYLQGRRGQTLGKKQQGIILLDNATGQPVGIGMVFVRGLLGGVLAIPCLLDLFWMFKDEARLRLSDQILEFQVRQV